MALAEKGKRGRLLVFLGAAPGVGKTYAMLQRARLLREEGVDVVIGLVETHSRAETEALTRGLEILPRKTVRWQGRQIEEFDLDGALAPPAQADHRRRTRPHQRAGEPPSQALAGRRGAARRAHRRLDRAQHPAPRKPRRRRLAHHRRHRARDRARHRAARRRRHRARRHHLRGADPAPQGRQGLSAGDGQAGAAEVLHPAQSDGAARDRAAPHRGAGRRPDGRAAAPERDRGPVGDRRAPAGLRRPGRAVDGRRARREPPRHRPQRELGRGDRRPRRAGDAAGGGKRSTTRCAWRKASARKRRGWSATTCRPKSCSTRSARTSPRSSSAARRPASSAVSPAARCRTRWCGAPASSACMSSPATSRARAPRVARLAAALDRELPIGALAAAGSVAVAVGVGEVLDRWLRLPNLSMIFLIAVLLSAARFGVRAAIVAAVLSFFAYDFFFIPPLLPVHHRRAAGILRPRHLPRRGEPGRLARRPGARPGAAGARKRPGDALAVRALAQAFRRGDARRHPGDDDRLCAEDAAARAASSCCCPRTANCR